MVMTSKNPKPFKPKKTPRQKELSIAFSPNDYLTEAEAHIKLFNFVGNVKFGDGYLGKYMHHSPNGEKREHVVNPKTGRKYSPTGNKLKMMGVRPGFPDIFLSVIRKGYGGLFIELKDKGAAKGRKKGVVSDVQEEWLKQLNEQGYLAVACWGYDEALDAIKDYMGIARNEKGMWECDLV